MGLLLGAHPLYEKEGLEAIINKHCSESGRPCSLTYPWLLGRIAAMATHYISLPFGTQGSTCNFKYQGPPVCQPNIGFMGCRDPFHGDMFQMVTSTMALLRSWGCDPPEVPGGEEDSVHVTDI